MKRGTTPYEHAVDSGHSNCELLLDFDHSALSKEKLQEVYHIITTYRFPMSQNPINQTLIKHLSTEETELLTTNEYAFIKAKINAIDPEVRPVLLPKSLYQLFYMLYHLKGIQSLPPTSISESDEYAAWCDEMSLLSFKWLPGNNCDYYQYCYDYINKKEVFAVWQKVNAFILPYLKNIEITEKSISSLVKQLFDEIAQIIRTNLNNHESFDIFANTSRFMLKLPSDAITAEATKIIQFEWASKDKPYHLIYRGTLDFRKSERGYYNENNQPKAVSLSYSDGLFAGFCCDANTGMCFAYLVQKDYPCIAVFIPKGSELFFIPPISTIAAMNGDYEYHHPRSKMPNLQESFVGNVPYGLKYGIHQITSAENEAKVRELLVTKSFDDLTIYDGALKSFLAEKAMFIKDMNSIKRSRPGSSYFHINSSLKKVRQALNKEIANFDKSTLSKPRL